MHRGTSACPRVVWRAPPAHPPEAGDPPFAPKGQKIAAQGTTLGNRAWKRQALKGRYRPRRFHPVHFTFCRRPSLPVPIPLALLVKADQPPKLRVIAQPREILVCLRRVAALRVKLNRLAQVAEGVASGALSEVG